MKTLAVSILAALALASAAAASPLPRPPHFKAFLCIHRFEGSWTDHGGPYWGGLQMDLTFQATYAAALARRFGWPDFFKQLGTADHWTPLQQMWVAEMALPTRGFGPWPTSGRECGLL